MTYRQLIDRIGRIDVDRLDDIVTVYDSEMDEFYPVQGINQSGEECDVLDEGHVYLEIKS